MYSPEQLQSPKYMVTMKIIKQSFGDGFKPDYPALNTFEQYCKDHWGTGVRDGLIFFFSTPDPVIAGTFAKQR